MDGSEVVDLSVVEEEVKDVAWEEAEAEDKVTIPIHFIIYMVMKILFLKLRYMIKVNINHCLEINKLQFKNSKVQLVRSMDIPLLMDMFYMTKEMQLYKQV